jgi:hypothetical protein
LVVYSNAVKALEIAFQQFETIAWWRLEINQIGSAVEVVELLACSLEDVGGEPFQESDGSSVENRFCCLVPERNNHRA